MQTYLIEPQTVFVPFLERVLSAAGLTVVATNHKVDATDLGAHAPRVVFVDVDYFDRGGPTVLCRIRETLHNTMLIALSESVDPVFVATCIIAGANIVCYKDVEETFVRSVRQGLTRFVLPTTPNARAAETGFR